MRDRAPLDGTEAPSSDMLNGPQAAGLFGWDQPVPHNSEPAPMTLTESACTFGGMEAFDWGQAHGPHDHTAASTVNLQTDELLVPVGTAKREDVNRNRKMQAALRNTEYALRRRPRSPNDWGMKNQR